MNALSENGTGRDAPQYQQHPRDDAQPLARERQLAAELRESREYYRSIFAGAREGFFILEKDDTGAIRFTDANSAWEAISGIRVVDLLGSRPADVLPPEMAERVNALCKRVFETGEPAEIEHTNLLPRGQVTSRTQFQLLPAYQVSRERILGISEDISSRRHTEELLQAYSRELQRSNRELENFAHIASHDLQEPLRKVQAFGDRLKTRYADVLDETGRDYLERMQGAARRMQTLIQDLLAYSRVTSKAESFEPVDLRDVAERVVQDLSTRVDRTGGQVIIECLPKVEADPLQMRQLFQNLIANALKFHREGVPPLVTISGEALHGTAEIRVADNGIGFEMEYAERMFRLFERLHGRMQYEGTGIGLPIVQKIVERHGGSIRAESAPGAGATFVVRLPIHQNDTIRTT